MEASRGQRGPLPLGLGAAEAERGELARIADALERIARHLDGAPQQAQPRRQALAEVPVTETDLAAADAVARRFGLRFKRGAR